jgi:Lipid A core - O-antigen ligase and related enzymes
MSTGASTIYPAPTRPGTPFLIFCLYTFILIGRPQDFIPPLAPLRLALVFTVLLSFVTLLQNRKGILNLFRQRESKLYLLFFGIMCAGIPFAIYRRASFDFVILRYVVNMVFFTLCLLHVNTLEKFKRVVAVLMFSGFFFSIFGLVQGNFQAGRFTTGGDVFDPNDVAYIGISLFPFSMSVLVGSYRFPTKIIALSGLLLCVLLTLYTGSRGGLIGFMILVLLFLFLPIPRVKKLYKVLVIMLFIAVAIINVDKMNMERYQTLGHLDQDYNLSDEFGREQIWKRGLQIFFENPITGVGVTGFSEALGNMRERENLPSQRWQTAHNSYLLVMVETGIFGVTVFIYLIGKCVKTFNQFRKRREASVEKDFSTMSGIFLIGFIAQLFMAFFLSQAYSMIFTLYFAISAALNGFVPIIGEEKTYV